MKKATVGKKAGADRQQLMTLFENSPKIKDFVKNCNTYATGRTYKISIREFFLWKQTDPDTYLKDPKKMPRAKEQEYLETIQKDLENFLYYLKNERQPPIYNTANPLAALKGLLKRNKIQLDDSFWENLRKKSNGERVSRMEWLTLDQLRKILKDADIEAKAFFMVQMTSLSRINEIVTLGFDDLDMNHEYPRITIKPENSKNGKQLRKRISPEAKHYLLDYLKQRDSILQTRIQRTPTNRRKTYSENRVFPMSKQNAEEIWKRLLQKADLYQQDPRTKRPRLGTHALRKYGCSKLENEDLANFLRGERTKANITYFEYSDEQIDRIYKQHVNNLLVLQTPENTEYRIDMIEDDNKLLQEDNKHLRGTIDVMTRRERALSDKVKEIDTLSHRINDLEHINREFKAPEEFITSFTDALFLLVQSAQDDIKKQGDKSFWYDKREQINNLIDSWEGETIRTIGEKKYKKIVQPDVTEILRRQGDKIKELEQELRLLRNIPQTKKAKQG